MKKSIAYLPKRKQKDLNFFVEEIRKRLPETEMIILYGSYDNTFGRKTVL